MLVSSLLTRLIFSHLVSRLVAAKSQKIVYGKSTDLPTKETDIHAPSEPPQFEYEKTTLDVVFQRMDWDIKSFFARLRSFVSEASFEVTKFLNQADELRAELAILGELVDKVSPHESLEIQLRFSSQMFTAMVESAELLSHYIKIEAPGNRLLYKMIELKVRALVLHDSHGKLDLMSPEQTEKVRSLIRSLNFWESRFNELVGVRFGTRRMFGAQVVRAANVLNALYGQFPRSHEYFFDPNCQYECLRQNA